VPAKKARKKRVPRKARPGSLGLMPAECLAELRDPRMRETADRVASEGGTVVGCFNDPLGGSPLLVAVLPLDRIEPTPFQRDLSEAHHKKLAGVIQQTGTFLDPVITVPAPGGGFWTPNGRHRLEAMRRLGAKAITTLITPKRELAWQILALNTEKAHNLKERSLEVVRIYRGLIDEDASRPEAGFAFYLEEAALVTLGMCYEQKASFAGAAYHPILRRLEEFSDEALRKTSREHEKTARQVLELEERVSGVIQRLKDRGLTSPYLRTFVVARINPLRWMKGDLPPLDQVLKTMHERAARFNVDKIQQKDLAGMGGAAEEE
jgi:ParB family transcriptional regulator, chromosome partitioning protein